MDQSDPNITFDVNGVSNWWHGFHDLKNQMPDESEKYDLLSSMIKEIKESKGNSEYNCIVGISGGIDSSYLTLLTHEWGLKPLIVHFDNGWNDEMAVSNIGEMISGLEYKLHTFVMEWREFRDLQRAYLKASVIDLEVPTDHMIFGALFRIAHDQKIPYILSGNNLATEWVLPSAWYYRKSDAVNIKAIHATHGELPMKRLPILNGWRRLYYERFRNIKVLEPLNLINYKKSNAKSRLIQEFNWQDYGGKHFESVFTRFYQGYILPRKFGIDKRKAHLTNLILNEEITRQEAISELRRPPYEYERQELDKRFVSKKLGWTEIEFEEILNLPNVPHEEFSSDEDESRRVDATRNALSKLKRIFKVNSRE